MFDRENVSEDKLLDVRVNNLLTWLWENFPSYQLEVKFVPGDFDVKADILSRWGMTSYMAVTGESEMSSGQVSGTGKGDGESLQANESEIFHESEEGIWKQLHGGHVGLKTMLYHSQVWNMSFPRDKLQRDLEGCVACVGARAAKREVRHVQAPVKKV